MDTNLVPTSDKYFHVFMGVTNQRRLHWTIGFIDHSFTITCNHNQLQFTINLRPNPSSWTAEDSLHSHSDSVKVILRLKASQPISKSWCRGPSGGSWPDIYYCLTVTVLFLWGAVPEERTGLSFVYAARPCQSSFLGSESQVGTCNEVNETIL
jgi:hypothetical protein